MFCKPFINISIILKSFCKILKRFKIISSRFKKIFN